MNRSKGMLTILGVVVALLVSAVALRTVADVREADSRPRTKGENVHVAGIYGADTRVFVPQYERPWHWIGRLTTDKSDCTAFLVNACTILTVAHCFKDEDDAPYYKDPKFFRAGEAPLPLQNLLAGNPREGAEGLEGEWAIAQIPVGRDGKYLGERIGHFVAEFATAADLANERQGTYCLAGYSFDKQKNGGQALSVDPDITFKAYRDINYGHGPENLIGHTGDAFGGASGGPIFQCKRKADGTFEFGPKVGVAAIHIASPKYRSKSGTLDLYKNPHFPDISKLQWSNYSTGMATMHFIGHVRKYLNEHPCFGPDKQPLVTHPSTSGKRNSPSK